MLDNIKAIPQEHLWAKARMLSEGVRGELPLNTGQADVAVDLNDIEQILGAYADSLGVREQTPIKELGNVIALDGSNVQVPIIINPYSRLELVREGDRAVVRDGDQVVLEGTVPTPPAWWREGQLSNGLPVRTVLPVMSEGIINLAFNLSCMNMNSRQGCQYCNLFANPVARKLTMLPKETLAGYARYQAEAVKIALSHGWGGQITVSGGALPPALRGESIERLQIVLDALGEAVGSEAFAKLQKVYNHYPPEHPRDMMRWKALGITATSIDLEVMDDAYFAAICPGKHAYKPLADWKRAQQASVEIFGPYTGSMGIIVVGMEPQHTLLKGVKERLEKGVLPLPFVFYSAPGSAYWGFRPPTADWLMETTEKIADVFINYLPQIIQSFQVSGDQPPAAPSLANCLVFDELQRRTAALFGGQQ
ncbi:MAG: hypothetical protein H6707_12475 [Deltaproteobacteria bacterium]|nr:hypothetical protein [Deltaproteobacteria bacterium]